MNKIKNKIITLDDDNDYAVFESADYNNERYLYLININNLSDHQVCRLKIVNDDLCINIINKDNEEYNNIINAFAKNIIINL